MREPQADPSDIPSRLRAAREGYGNTIAASLAAAGFEDLPRNGPFVLDRIANNGSAVEMIRGLGVTRQAASQLIETLVLRGYLSREVNAIDRRRMDIALTERGRAAAAAIRAAGEQVDRELSTLLSPDQLCGLRAGLAALSTISERTAHDGPPKEH